MAVRNPFTFLPGIAISSGRSRFEIGARRLANMIKVQNLVKIFGSKRAVDGVSFSVERGEVLGFLGPNGAGKSTSMRMITGFIPPTEGTVTVGGFDMVENPIPAKTADWLSAGKCAGVHGHDCQRLFEFCG